MLQVKSVFKKKTTWQCPIYRVRTDPGKVWKVLEFNVEIFKTLKSLENDNKYGKLWKNP